MTYSHSFSKHLLSNYYVASYGDGKKITVLGNCPEGNNSLTPGPCQKIQYCLLYTLIKSLRKVMSKKKF